MSIPSETLASVIVPCKDRSELLRRCLVSVAAQTHRPIQVVIVDDGSSEPIAEVVRSIAWPPGVGVELLRNETSSGPGGAREVGRQAARGDVVAYLDSDDIWAPDLLTDALEVLEASGVDMVYCGVADFEGEPDAHAAPREGSRHGVDRFLPTVLSGRPWCTSACVWRRSATDRIGTWLPGWAWEDYEYEVRAGILRLRVGSVPRVNCHFRKDDAAGHLSQVSYAGGLIRRVPAILSIGNRLVAAGLWDGGNGRLIERTAVNAVLALLDERPSGDADELCRFLGANAERAASRAYWRSFPVVSRVLGRRASTILTRRLRRRGWL